VLRIFGETPGGQNACLHIHRSFPYLYVPYDDDLPRAPELATSYLRGLAEALDRALDYATAAAAGIGNGVSVPDRTNARVAATTDGYGATGAPSSRPFASRDAGAFSGRDASWSGRRLCKKIVHECSLVRARSMYGFRALETLFIKIAVYDPSAMARVRAALLSGGVGDRTFQPFEAHVPFQLQAMMDLNLHGAGLVRCAEVCFREPVPRWPRLHARRVATRRRLRLNGAAAYEECAADTEGFGAGGATRTKRALRRSPVELEYEDVEPTSSPRDSEPESLDFGVFDGAKTRAGGDAAAATSAQTPSKKRSVGTVPS
jgi:hypothetical protein